MGRRDYGGGSIEQRSSGHWRVTVELPREALTGRRRRRRFTVAGNKRDAQRALREALRERDHGGVEPSRTLVAEWVTRWLAQRVDDQAVGAIAARNYRLIVRKHINPAIGHVRLRDLRPEHVLELKEGLSKSLAPATVGKIMGLLRQSLDAAVRQHLLVHNPASVVPKPSVSAAARERRALDEGEIAALLRLTENTDYDAIIRFALATGARQAELLGATWDSIDLERGSFVVRQTLQHVEGEFLVLPPKTRRSRRTIELSAATVALLRRHRAEQQAARMALGPAWEDRGLVFPGANGGYQHRRTLYGGYRRLLNASGIADPGTVNFHSLRHTAASQWIKAGVDLLTVSRRLGHGSAAFTMDVYGHLLSGQQRAAAEALDHLIA